MVNYRPEQVNEAFLPDKKYPEEGLVSAEIYPGDERHIKRLLQGEESKLGEYRIVEYLGRPSDRPWPKLRSNKNKNQITWRIRCSCGLEKDINHDALTSFRSAIKKGVCKPHCSCPAHEPMFQIGNQYDLLTILGYKKCTPEEAGRTKQKNDWERWYLLCSCKCGKHTHQNPYMTTPHEISYPLSKGMKGFGCGCKQSTHNQSNTDAYQRMLRAKTRAKNKNLEFNLDIENCIAPAKCPIFGIPLIASKGKNQTANSPHLDRLIGSKGYIKENVTVISMKANSIKNSATVEQIRLVADWFEKKLLEIKQQDL